MNHNSLVLFRTPCMRHTGSHFSSKLSSFGIPKNILVLPHGSDNWWWLFAECSNSLQEFSCKTNKHFRDSPIKQTNILWDLRGQWWQELPPANSASRQLTTPNHVTIFLFVQQFVVCSQWTVPPLLIQPRSDPTPMMWSFLLLSASPSRVRPGPWAQTCILRWLCMPFLTFL